MVMADEVVLITTSTGTVDSLRLVPSRFWVVPGYALAELSTRQYPAVPLPGPRTTTCPALAPAHEGSVHPEPSKLGLE